MTSKPVSEVLLEAAEYLCKLGHNLKVRSENLKLKRLRTGKLKTAEAVKKASNKMLLICTMSKQSIDNVEDSVKKILQVCDDTATDSRVLNTSERNEIIFPQNINIDYYLSCKVIVRNMSLEEISIYKPLRHVLKRKKIEEEVKEIQSDDNRSVLESTIEKVRRSSSPIKGTQGMNNLNDIDHTEPLRKQSTSSKEEYKMDSGEKERKKKHKQAVGTNMEDSVRNNNPTEEMQSTTSDNEETVESRKIKHSLVQSKSNDSICSTANMEEKEVSEVVKKDCAKGRQSSSDSERNEQSDEKQTKSPNESDVEENKSNRDNENSDLEEIGRSSSGVDEDNKKDKSQRKLGKKKKYRRCQFLHSPSDSDKSCQEEDKISIKGDVSKDADLPPVNSTISESNKESKENNAVCISSDEDKAKNENCEISALKLIDINKLLKPDLVTAVSSKSMNNAVTNFKAKKFKIILEKYKLTKKFMKQHKIKAIIKNGVIIKSLNDVKTQKKQVTKITHDSERLPNNSNSSKSLNRDTVKQSLLNDSDTSDDVPIKSILKNSSMCNDDTVRQERLNCSDSNKEEAVLSLNNDKSPSDNPTEEQGLLDDNNSNEKTVKSFSDNDMEKQSLLHDSDSNYGNVKRSKKALLNNPDEEIDKSDAEDFSVNDSVKQSLLEESDSSKEEAEPAAPRNEKVRKRLRVASNSSTEETETGVIEKRSKKMTSAAEDKVVRRKSSIKENVDQIKNALLAESDSEGGIDRSKNNTDDVSKTESRETICKKVSKEEPVNNSSTLVTEELFSENNLKEKTEANLNNINTVEKNIDAVKNSLLQDSDGEQTNENKDPEVSHDKEASHEKPGPSDSQTGSGMQVRFESSDEEYFDGAINRLTDILKRMSGESENLDWENSDTKLSNSSDSDSKKRKKSKKSDTSRASSIDKNENRSGRRRKGSGDDKKSNKAFKSKKKVRK